jgi:hypothetical protein
MTATTPITTALRHGASYPLGTPTMDMSVPRLHLPTSPTSSHWGLARLEWLTLLMSMSTSWLSGITMRNMTCRTSHMVATPLGGTSCYDLADCHPIFTPYFPLLFAAYICLAFLLLTSGLFG